MTLLEPSSSHQHQPCAWGGEVSCISSHLNPKLLVSLDHHPTHFKGVGVLTKSENPLCLNGFIVASPHNVAIISNLLQLCILPEALLSRTTGGPHLFAELLMGRLYCCIFSVQACPGNCPQLLSQDQSWQCSPKSQFLRPGIILAHTHNGVSISISLTPRVLYNHSINRVCVNLSWTGTDQWALA